MARAIVSTISASSGGLKNYYENPKAEADVTTGVTITVGATVTEETTNQIEDDVSYLVTQDNSGSNADVRFAIIDIDQYVTDEALIIRSGAYIRTDAADADGDVTFGIWNDTDAMWMHGPESLTGGGDLNIVSTLLSAPLQSGKVYQGRLLRTDNTNGREMIVDKLELSPDNGGAILTEADEVNPGVVKQTIIRDFSSSSFSITSGQSATFSHKTCYVKVYEDVNGNAFADLSVSFRMTGIGGVADQVLTVNIADLISFVLPDTTGFGVQYVQGQPDEIGGNTAERYPLWQTNGNVQWSAEPFSTGLITIPDSRRFMWTWVNVPVTLV
jgi:hypothetical protein